MATVRELTLPMALELAANLGARDRMEILRAYPDLDSWALDRCTLPGNAWALIEDGQVMRRWGHRRSRVQRHAVARRANRLASRSVKHAVRIWRAIRESGLYRRVECQCAEDNVVAQRFAERMGFQREGVCNGLVDFGIAA
jgi:hypothetical protein